MDLPDGELNPSLLFNESAVLHNITLKHKQKKLPVPPLEADFGLLLLLCKRVTRGKTTPDSRKGCQYSGALCSKTSKHLKAASWRTTDDDFKSPAECLELFYSFAIDLHPIIRSINCKYSCS